MLGCSPRISTSFFSAFSCIFFQPIALFPIYSCILPWSHFYSILKRTKFFWEYLTKLPTIAGSVTYIISSPAKKSQQASNPRKVFIYSWYEADAAKGSAQITSAVFHCLNDTDYTNVSTVRLFFWWVQGQKQEFSYANAPGHTSTAPVLVRGEPWYNSNTGVPRQVLKPKVKVAKLNFLLTDAGIPVKQQKMIWRNCYSYTLAKNGRRYQISISIVKSFTGKQMMIQLKISLKVAWCKMQRKCRLKIIVLHLKMIFFFKYMNNS